MLDSITGHKSEKCLACGRWTTKITCFCGERVSDRLTYGESETFQAILRKNRLEASTPAATIVEVHYIPTNTRRGRYQATVMAEMSDGELVDALTYYADELYFDLDDFYGRTLSQVSDMFRRKDIAYLQS